MTKYKVRPETGMWLEVNRGNGFLMFRGVEQPEKIGRKPLVEVGPIRTAGLRVRPGEVTTIAIELLHSAMPHLAECSGCQHALVDLLHEVRDAMTAATQAKEKK